LWQKNYRRDFNGQCGNWDFSESPLIDGDSVICTPGGPTASVVSLNRRTGAVIWLGSTEALGNDYGRAAYSSAIVAEVDGVRQYIQFLNKGVASFRAKDGQLLWHYDAPANSTANCSTPIYRDGSVFAASGYGTGGGRAKLERRGSQFEAVEEYFVKKLQNHHGGVVLFGDHLYGTNDGSLLCVDWNSGEVLWQDRSVGKGSVTCVDGHLIVRGEGGTVALVAADPTGYREVARFEQPRRSDKNAWAHPVVAGGKLYLRDDNILLCYEMK
jgi:outer membrane protein assembly factor BamB